MYLYTIRCMLKNFLKAPLMALLIVIVSISLVIKIAVTT